MNHCVEESLQSALDTDLLESKCNIHPLDGIAKKCVDTLKLYDAEWNVTSDTFGKDSCAVNFIHMGWQKCNLNRRKEIQLDSKEFMHQENIRPGMIVHYVGNRFHWCHVSSCSCFLSSERETVKIFRQYLSLLNSFSFSAIKGPEKWTAFAAVARIWLDGTISDKILFAKLENAEVSPSA